MKTYQIAIVDDEALFRQGISMLVNDHDLMVTSLAAENGEDLMKKLANCDDLPHLLLCDLEMPLMNGVDVTREIQTNYPEIKVVILSSHYEPSLIMKMMEIGASAFMPKNEKPEEFYLTIINVIEKGFHYNDYVVQLIREKMLFGSKKKNKASAELTDREQEVLQLICDQRTNKEIGELLFISTRTVEGHRKNLLEKTSSKNTAGLIIYAIENGYCKVNITNQWNTRDF